ncbi:MAG: hypothetical protein J6S95_00630 [Lachnospiraceae bacterium]|nr:hypothetical protein [Lachnospiraceae bacterium]
MKKFVLILMCICVFSLCACADTPAGSGLIPGGSSKEDVRVLPELSENILIGFDWDDGGFGTEIESTPAIVKVYKDKRVTAEFMDNLIYEGTIDDSSYSNIESGLDLKKLYFLEVEPDTEVLDGFSEHVFFYGPDDAIIKTNGAYMPKTEAFNLARQILTDNLPMASIDEAVSNIKSAMEVKFVYADYLRMYMTGGEDFYLVGSLEAVTYDENYCVFYTDDLDGDGIIELMMSPYGYERWTVRNYKNSYNWDKSVVGVFDCYNPDTKEFFYSVIDLGGRAQVMRYENGEFVTVRSYYIEEEDIVNVEEGLVDVSESDGSEYQISYEEFMAIYEDFHRYELKEDDYYKISEENIAEHLIAE